MEVTVELEAGYIQAIEGIGLSYGIKDIERLKNTALKLAFKDGGHNKFLESIQVWLRIKAPRYWWQEFDTYRVGTTKQSESTIHTLCRKEVTKDDFSGVVPESTLSYLNSAIDSYNATSNHVRKNEWFKFIKVNLPEGYFQTRMVCTNYKVLRNIIFQRKNHTLKEWAVFISTIKEQVKNSELLF